MPSSTVCPKCGAVLNLPDHAVGKRLRCPRCQNRFQVSGPTRDQEPPSDQGGGHSASSVMLSTRTSEPELPTAEGDLRDTFSADLLDGPAVAGRSPSSSKVTPPQDDAADLLQDDDLPMRPRRGVAEARSQARRCPSCSSVVPQGMSLCGRCGLDLDSGARHIMDDLLGDEPLPAPRGSGPPISILAIGGITFIASLFAAVAAVIQSQKPDTSQFGYLSLALVGLFGVYASVQFMRLKSLRLLVIALMLAAIVDAIGLIAIPIFNANNPSSYTASTVTISPDLEDIPAIPSVTERLGQQLWVIKWGIAILLLDAALLVFVSTPLVRNHF